MIYQYNNKNIIKKCKIVNTTNSKDAVIIELLESYTKREVEDYLSSNCCSDCDHDIYQTLQKGKRFSVMRNKLTPMVVTLK